MAEAKQKGSLIFPDTVPFKKQHIDELKEKVDRYLGEIGLVSVLVGSGSDPGRDGNDSSSDLDLMVDLQSIMDYFKTDDKSMARKQLSNYLQDRGFQTVQKGVNVFLRMPYGKYAHQIDLECIHKVAKVSRYHQHRIPKGSPYKGVNKDRKSVV
jgi:predicted nucleotidyltransferase